MTQKKIKARIFFGEALSDAVSEGDMKEAKKILSEGDGSYIEREFATQAEKDAYFQGLADYDGWMGFYPLGEREKTPKWAKAASNI